MYRLLIWTTATIYHRRRVMLLTHLLKQCPGSRQVVVVLVLSVLFSAFGKLQSAAGKNNAYAHVETHTHTPARACTERRHENLSTQRIFRERGSYL